MSLFPPASVRKQRPLTVEQLRAFRAALDKSNVDHTPFDDAELTEVINDLLGLAELVQSIRAKAAIHNQSTYANQPSIWRLPAQVD